MLFFRTQRHPDLMKPGFSLVDNKASTEPSWCTNSAHGAPWAGQRTKVWRKIALERDLTLGGVRAKPVWTRVDLRLSGRQRRWCSIASAFNNTVRNPWISLGISNIFWISSGYSLPNHKGIYFAQMCPSTACAAAKSSLNQSNKKMNDGSCSLRC